MRISAYAALFLRMLLKELLDLFLTVDTAEEFLHLDFTLQLHQTIEESFRARRATGFLEEAKK